MNRHDTAGRRVLVVDDNEDVARSLALLLRTLGHRVAVCHDGADAVETARNFRPEVAFLDLHLPLMDGVEIARQLRREHGRQMVLVALSGDHRAGPEGPFREDFDHRLLKPVDVEHIRLLLITPPALN